jgi:hypothetical protein
MKCTRSTRNDLTALANRPLCGLATLGKDEPDSLRREPI